MMIPRRMYELAIAAALLVTSVSANADIPFSGMITGIGAGATTTSCAPAPARGTLDPATSIGTSTLGSFTYGHSWCFYGPSGPINGTFNIFFGPDTLQGTVTGLATPTGTTGLTDLNLAYTILGGTGLFSGATGSFGGIATADARGRSPTSPVFTLNFTGNIDAPSLPEPQTWAMMLLGFGGMGLAMRQQKSRSSAREVARR